MPAPVRIIFTAEGTAAIQNAYKTIAKGAQELSRLQAAEARRTVTIGRQAANDNVRAANDASKKTIDLTKNTDRIRERSAIAAGKYAAQVAKQEAKAATDATRALEQEIKRRDKIRERSAQMAGRYAEQAARAEAQAAQRAQAANAKFARNTSNVLGRGVRGAVGTMTGIGAGLGMVGGGAMIGSALMEGVSLNRQAALLSNASAMPGFAPQDPAALAAQARDLAARTGFKATGVMEAMSTVSARAGGAEGLEPFRKDIEDLSKTAVAAGVSIEDMGAVYAAALKAGVKPGDEMKQVMLDLVQMGKAGAVEFKDLAGQLPQMAGMGKLMSQGGAGMVREVVALSQFAVEQQVGPEEARTAVKHAIQEIAMKGDILKKSGVKTIDEKTGKLLSPTDVIAETMSAAYDTKRGIKFGKETKFGAGALASLFGERGMAISNVMTDTFMQGGKGASGAQAVKDRIRKMMGATMTGDQRDKEYARVMGTDAQKLDVAMEGFKNKIAELIPRFTELLPTVLKVTESFAKLAVAFANNPFTGMSAVLAGFIAKEIGAALAGKAFESALSTMLNNVRGNGTFTPLPGTGGNLTTTGGVAGNLAALGTIALTATAVYLTATKVIDEVADASKRKGAGEMATLIGGENTLRVLGGKKGPLTAEELASAKAARESIAGIQEDRSTSGWGKAWKRLMGGDIMGAAQESTVMGRAFEKANKGAGGAYATEDPKVLLAGFDKLIGAAEKMNTAADKMSAASGNMSNPNNPDRQGAPARSGIK